MDKKQYNVFRKNKADLHVLIRGIVAAYLLYLGWKLVTSGGDASFPPAAGYAVGALFAAGAIAFGCYAWKRYRADLRDAELTPEEEEEALRQEREP